MLDKIEKLASKITGIVTREELNLEYNKEETKEAIRQYWAAKEHLSNMHKEKEEASKNVMKCAVKAITALYDENKQLENSSLSGFKIPTLQDIEQQQSNLH